jgi:hypothetical protein
MGLVPTSTRLTQGLFRLPSKRCAVVLSGPRQLVLLLPPSLLSSHHSELSSPRTPSSATGGVRKKKCPVATLAFAAIMSSGSFFSLLSSCHVLGVCWLRQGFRWPYRRTCGFFARHACGSKLIPPPALSVSMVVFLSYLAGPPGVSHITSRCARRSVEHSQHRAQLLMSCPRKSVLELLIKHLIVDRDYWLFVGFLSPGSDIRSSLLRFAG